MYNLSEAVFHVDNCLHSQLIAEKTQRDPDIKILLAKAE